MRMHDLRHLHASVLLGEGLPLTAVNLHRALDEAVFAAYGWPTDLSAEEILERLLAENLRRSAMDPSPRAAVP